tara:strand:+ start:5766 stop:6377 length:612 start_codon:yes stop_codon:yes gene_type:complete
MCGVAEATLALGVVSAVTGFVAANDMAKAQQRTNQRIDDSAYAAYKSQLKAIDRKQAQERRKIGAKQFEVAVEKKQTQGRTQAELDQMGLDQFGLTGASPDTFFKDIRFQSSVAGARLEQYQTDMVQEMSSNREMAYLNYLSRNAQIAPVAGPSILELGTDIASAGLGYYQDPTRMRSTNSNFATGTLHNFGYSGRASVGDYI